MSDDTAEFIPRNLEHPPARPEAVLPATLQLVPLTSRPFFPVLVQPVVVDKTPWGEGIKTVAESAHKLIALSYARPVEGGLPNPGDICQVGCVARIHRIHEAENKLQFIAQGIRRFRIVEWIRESLHT